jgi:signal transduction histidine kinase
MTRTTRLWLIVALSLTVGVIAVGWLGATVLRLDAAQRTAQREAAYEEAVRLALWRADALVTPTVVREQSRTPAEFNLLSGPPWIRTTGVIALGFEPDPLVKLRFRVDGAGVWSSPSLPINVDGTPDTSLISSYPQYQRTQQALESLKAQVTKADLLALVPADQAKSTSEDAAEPAQAAKSYAQNRFNKQELDARQRMLDNAQVRAQQQAGNLLQQAALPFEDPPPAMSAAWHSGHLLLLRRGGSKTAASVHGCWLDWPAIRTALTEEVAEVLPEARFVPANPNATDLGRRLASLPIRLVPGPATGLPAIPPSPLPLLLSVALGAALLSALAVVALLIGVISLSERRGAFVSAVTHELRTPLTTFRLYTELLADNVVSDPDKRRQYLQTLYREADRLAHLVDNVLAYARLERGRAGARVETMSLDGLLTRVTERLQTRADQAGLALEVNVAPEVRNCCVRTAPASFEQILLNLVDNACKYAADGEQQKIQIAGAFGTDGVSLLVRDFGPGIPAAQRKRLFEPFHKSAPAAAESAPGVGLGLALCRRLARDMGATLQLQENVQSGACFELRLRRAD